MKKIIFILFSVIASFNALAYRPNAAVVVYPQPRYYDVRPELYHQPYYAPVVQQVVVYPAPQQVVYPVYQAYPVQAPMYNNGCGVSIGSQEISVSIGVPCHSGHHRRYR